VGYQPDGLPFTFFNQAENLVGLDTQLAYNLSRDLNVDLEFIPFRYPVLADFLNTGVIDVAMGGIGMTPRLLNYLPYFAEQNIATGVCTPCAKNRDLEEKDFYANMKLDGGPHLIDMAAEAKVFNF